MAIRAMDAMLEQPDKVLSPTIKYAVDEYLKDCTARKLAPATILSYRNVLFSFRQYCENRSPHQTRGLRFADLSGFRAQRSSFSAKTQRKEIEHLRAFCAFCVQHGWMKENYAKLLKPPKNPGPSTMPYEPWEVEKLLAACDLIDNFDTENIGRSRKRARALLLLLLHSGMRISDAVKLERSRVDKDGRIMLRTMKSGTTLYVKLHPDCVAALNALPVESPYFLWSGNGKLSSAVGSARRTISCVARLAGVKARPHRFRAHFSVSLLLMGTDIRDVQLLLGHSSIRTTEASYSHFVAAMQSRLDAATDKLQYVPRGLSGDTEDAAQSR